jgi:threonine dehydrogenase-like Zn-dependent dehydrogenase
MSIEFATTKLSYGFNGTKIAFAEKFIVHEDWNFFEIRNDIGLIKLTEPINVGLHDSYVKLEVPGRHHKTGTVTTVAGWGRTGNGMALSKHLQKVDLQIYSYADCKAAHSTSSMGLEVYRTNICAGVPEMQR